MKYVEVENIGGVRIFMPAVTGDDGKEVPYPHIPIADAELLRRAVTGARAKGRKPHPRWVGVSERFALGSTYSARLCKRFGLDPDEQVKP